MDAGDITIVSTLFTSAFFTLTGFHGLHVFVGLIALSVIGLLAQAGDFPRGRRRVAVDFVSIYWHFVAGIWVPLFALFCLLGLVSCCASVLAPASPRHPLAPRSPCT